MKALLLIILLTFCTIGLTDTVLTDVALKKDVASVLCCCWQRDGILCCAEMPYCIKGYIPGCMCK